jgi:hypothetical protein
VGLQLKTVLQERSDHQLHFFRWNLPPFALRLGLNVVALRLAPTAHQEFDLVVELYLSPGMQKVPVFLHSHSSLRTGLHSCSSVHPQNGMDLFCLIEAASNEGFCPGVWDVAGITAITNTTDKTTCFIISSAKRFYQCDPEVRVRERKNLYL